RGNRFLTIAALGAACIAISPAACAARQVPAQGLTVPAGFTIELFAQGLSKPRFMAVAPNGDLLVAQPVRGDVVALHGPASNPVVVASGLDLPHGLAFDGSTLYIAVWDGVKKMTYPTGTVTRVLGGIPENTDHNFRSLAVAPDHAIYLGIGSSCNVCDDNPPLATVERIMGGAGRGYAVGMRNPSGLAFDASGRLWAVVNQRDDIGPTQSVTDDLPPDELDLVTDGADFGWPRCYPDPKASKRDPNPEYPHADCGGTKAASLNFQAHSAPLGIAFYEQHEFPASYRGGAFVAFHGSWNRRAPTGDKVVFVKFSHGRPTGYTDFVTGWLVDGRYTGRPAGLAVDARGDLYISDDQAGAIYRVTYRRASP
ncbi:MAG TPA: PQQ-dependent sugar dehydrogenase, partial [Candidatus Eremiobacteraceae bacterium]|nr:PQQ-dependent sugar dehydrogenase [Candidatus Eremiobacteraceae bacterium]